MAALEVSLPLIDAMILLDMDGKRIAVKYYNKTTWPDLESEFKFEKAIFMKTQRSNARGEPEIMLLDGSILVFKFIADLQFYVVANANNVNELIIANVLMGFFESANILLRNEVERRNILENLDLVLLIMDEIVDGGIVLETDPNNIANRVAMRGTDADMPLGEQTLGQALQNAKEQFARSLLK